MKSILLFILVQALSFTSFARSGADHVGNGGGRFEVEVWRLYLQLPKVAERCLMEKCSEEHKVAIRNLMDQQGRYPQLRFAFNEPLTICALQNGIAFSLPQENTIVFCSQRFYEANPRPNSFEIFALMLQELGNFLDLPHSDKIAQGLNKYLDQPLQETRFDKAIFLWRRNIENGIWTHAYWGTESDLTSFQDLIVEANPCQKYTAQSKAATIQKLKLDESTRQVHFTLHVQLQCSLMGQDDFLRNGIFRIFADKTTPKDNQVQWSEF